MFVHQEYINWNEIKIKVSFAGLIKMQQDTFPLHINEVEQINAIKANDEKILKALYQNNYYKVENYILNNNGSADQAKDIYQEAFIVLWRNIQLDKFHAQNKTALAGYLYQISKNKWMDYLRSSHHKKITTLNDETNGLQAEVLPEEENNYIIAVKNNFNHLGENCKEVLTRFYYKKEPLKVIARRFDWTEATARNNKYRCLQRLRELLKK